MSNDWAYPYFSNDYDGWKLGERREPREIPEACKGCEAPTCRGCEDNPDRRQEGDGDDA